METATPLFQTMPVLFVGLATGQTPEVFRSEERENAVYRKEKEKLKYKY